MDAKLFWQASLTELTQGYRHLPDKKEFMCLFCGKVYEEGLIYQTEGQLCEAEKALQLHIAATHGSAFAGLMALDKKYLGGFSELQKKLLPELYAGKKDADIARQLGMTSANVRNHRFRLKEKAKQARIFLAIMSLIENHEKEEDRLVDIHNKARMVDERYVVNETEQAKIIKTYFKTDGSLKNFPRKEKRKIIVLRHIMQQFEVGKKYTEQEVNEVLAQVFGDYVVLRRYLIQYGFLAREKDCSAYWVNS